MTKVGIKTLSCTMLILKSMKTLSGTPGHHGSYIKSDGSLWTVGKNDDGQLGIGTNADVNSPTIVSIGNFTVSLAGGGVSLGASMNFGVTKLATGGGHTIFEIQENDAHHLYNVTRQKPFWTTWRRYPDFRKCLQLSDQWIGSSFRR